MRLSIFSGVYWSSTYPIVNFLCSSPFQINSPNIYWKLAICRTWYKVLEIQGRRKCLPLETCLLLEGNKYNSINFPVNHLIIIMLIDIRVNFRDLSTDLRDLKIFLWDWMVWTAIWRVNRNELSKEERNILGRDKIYLYSQVDLHQRMKNSKKVRSPVWVEHQ